MTTRLRGWIVVGAVLLFCAGSIWFVARRRANAIDTPAGLLSRLPTQDSVILSIDFAALRRAGLVDLLARSQTPEEPEYQQFVAKTDFDYKQDLDLALASFAPAGKYFLLRGRFHWGNLTAYAKLSNGTCTNTFCQMPGSTAERKISFFPLRPGIMALAVSRESDAARFLEAAPPDARPLDPPGDPVWISVPGSVLQQQEKLPTGTKLFAQSLAGAEGVMLSLGPKGQDFAIHLTARCRSEQDAVSLQGELERATHLLVSMLEHENTKPNPGDLSGTLVSGSFHRADVRVYGEWPMSHELVANLLSGQAR